jgi:cyclopropane-fatty-acyl-phospholipid synthase
VTDLTAHYRRTIDQWRRRIANGGRAQMELTVPGFADEIDRYFDTANASWGYTAKHYALTATKARHGWRAAPQRTFMMDARSPG